MRFASSHRKQTSCGPLGPAPAWLFPRYRFLLAPGAPTLTYRERQTTTPVPDVFLAATSVSAVCGRRGSQRQQEPSCLPPGVPVVGFLAATSVSARCDRRGSKRQQEPSWLRPAPNLTAMTANILTAAAGRRRPGRSLEKSPPRWRGAARPPRSRPPSWCGWNDAATLLHLFLGPVELLASCGVARWLLALSFGGNA
jgi:hypothetical protein